MIDLIVSTLGTILTLLGIVGCVFPFLPGPPLSFAGLLLLAWTHHFSPPLTPILMIVMAAATAAVVAFDIVVPLIGAKRYGSSKWGMVGSFAGMILGFLFGSPLSVLLGAFLGAVVVEWVIHRQPRRALKAGWGVFVGTLLGTVLKLGVCGVMAFYFFQALLR